MSIAAVFIAIAAISAVWYVVSSILIYNDLVKRGERLNFLLIRLMLIPWVNRYKKLTVQETGNVGALYYHWIISVLTLFVAVVCALATKTSLT